MGPHILLSSLLALCTLCLCGEESSLIRSDMRILFIGDIVGSPGVNLVRRVLPARVGRERLDCVIANAENAAGGSGLTARLYRRLREAGIDLFTLGDHIYRKGEIIETLEKEDRLCKPANFPPEAVGREYALATARDGTPV